MRPAGPTVRMSNVTPSARAQILTAFCFSRRLEFSVERQRLLNKPADLYLSALQAYFPYFFFSFLVIFFFAQGKQESDLQILTDRPI